MRQPRRSARGQVAVEAALTLPLVLFVILGTLQLFMMLQGRVMAEYAAWRATRAGSVNHGDCRAMTDAAVLALLPSFNSYLGQGTPGASPGEKLARAWRARQSARYSPANDGGYSGDIVWIMRESPLPNALPNDDEDEFDQGRGPTRLEIRMVYWYPLRIPFANWVMARMFLAQYGLLPYTAQNPLIVTQNAEWRQEVNASFEPQVAQELLNRVSRGEYVFPIKATAGMRMMTPARPRFFTRRNCQPTPEFPL